MINVIELRLDKSEEVRFDGKHYIVPVIDKNNNKIDLEVSEEDMKRIITEGKFLLTDDCNVTKH